MKITDWIIVFLVIIFPLMLVSQWRAEDTNTFAKMNTSYDWAMTAASQDAVNELRNNVEPNFESGYASKKFSRINKEPAYDTFIHSLALNFQTNEQNPSSVDFLSRYVPAFGVLEYDGFSLNVYRDFVKNGQSVLERTWLPKIPFAYHDGMGNIVQFTLDNYAVVYDPVLREWIEGERKELLEDREINQTLRDFLADSEKFHNIRRTTIVNVLQENLAYEINNHNVYKERLGITYEFMLPLIDKEDWYNTVDDVGIFTFFQGHPYERADGVHNRFAFAGTRLVKQDNYIATTLSSGKKIFFAESCNFGNKVEEVYQSKRDAAAAGYFEMSCLNQ